MISLIIICLFLAIWIGPAIYANAKYPSSYHDAPDLIASLIVEFVLIVVVGLLMQNWYICLIVLIGSGAFNYYITSKDGSQQANENNYVNRIKPKDNDYNGYSFDLGNILKDDATTLGLTSNHAVMYGDNDGTIQIEPNNHHKRLFLIGINYNKASYYYNDRIPTVLTLQSADNYKNIFKISPLLDRNDAIWLDKYFLTNKH